MDAEDARHLVYEALHVPTRLEGDSARRSAAAALLRAHPQLGTILSIVERGTLPPDLWEQVEVALVVTDRANELLIEAITAGELDPIIGNYPIPDHTTGRDLCDKLARRLVERIAGGGDFTTIDELLKATGLPPGSVDPAWLPSIFANAFVSIEALFKPT